MKHIKTLTAMVTPFTKDAKNVNFEEAAKLANWLVTEQKNDGIVLAGTTGESSVITVDEHLNLIATVKKETNCYLVAGTGSNDTNHAIKMTQAAEKQGVDAILSVTPYYNKPPQEGLYEHFKKIAENTELPIILYDIPGRTGKKIETETLLRLAEIKNIVALKDAAGNPGETAKIIAETDLLVYSGDDSLLLPLLAVGGHGTISVASHWAGKYINEIIKTYDMDPVDARNLNKTLIPSYEFASMEHAPNPIPTKHMLETLGFETKTVRSPLDYDLNLEKEISELKATLIDTEKAYQTILGY